MLFVTFSRDLWITMCTCFCAIFVCLSASIFFHMFGFFSPLTMIVIPLCSQSVRLSLRWLLPVNLSLICTVAPLQQFLYPSKGVLKRRSYCGLSIIISFTPIKPPWYCCFHPSHVYYIISIASMIFHGSKVMNRIEFCNSLTFSLPQGKSFFKLPDMLFFDQIHTN